MKLLRAAQGIVPAVILCHCRQAVELDRDVSVCPACSQEFTKEGREIPQEGESEQ